MFTIWVLWVSRAKRSFPPLQPKEVPGDASPHCFDTLLRGVGPCCYKHAPHALECMAKNGFTHEMWVAKRAGTNAQVHPTSPVATAYRLRRPKLLARKTAISTPGISRSTEFSVSPASIWGWAQVFHHFRPPKTFPSGGFPQKDLAGHTAHLSRPASSQGGSWLKQDGLRAVSFDALKSATTLPR